MSSIIFYKALNHNTGDLYEYKNGLFSITMHIALSLEALGFGAILCYVLFIILGIYLILCILLYNALILAQESIIPLSKALIMTQGCILLSEIIL